MSGKVSKDFGLFKDKFQENQIRSIKLISIIIGIIIVFILIIYLCVYLSKQVYSNNYDDYSEELISLESNQRPKPFSVDFSGNEPSEFIPSTTTEKITTLNYPQLNNYKHRYYPNNIQDIINYVTRINQTTNHQTSGGGGGGGNGSDNKKIGLSPSSIIDPFYRYKPQNPSDVNLLALNNLRFAPPYWRHIKTTTIPPSLPPPLFPPRIYQQQYHENSNRKEVYRSNKNDFNRPLTVTVNIYPNDKAQQQQQHKYNNYHNNNNNNNGNNDMRVKFFEPNKMVIFLNIHPDRSNKSRL